MYIVIVGGGKVGEYLARFLLHDGNDVALIEEDPRIAKSLSEQISGHFMCICGNGCHLSTLEDAGILQADIMVAVTGRDEDNLAACEIANRAFNVPRAIARVNNPKNLRIFQRLGIESISSTALIARMVQEEAVLGSMSVALTMTTDDLTLIETKVNHLANYDSRTGVLASEIEVPDGIRIVAVNHDQGEDIEVVGTSTRIFSGDKVIVAADTDKADLARRIIHEL